MNKTVLLTFDLEEFDLPLEYGTRISEDEQLQVTNAGMQRLLKLLDKHNKPATFFITSFYAGKNADLVTDLCRNHEVASHSRSHSVFSDQDYYASKVILENITGTKINGFRMSRFAKTNFSHVAEAGYKYDSSINPTFVPGRYNYLGSSRTIWRQSGYGLTEVPVSVTPRFRFPLFWLSFKIIPLKYYLLMCHNTLRKDGYLHLCFHPWEFAELHDFRIPWYIRNISGEEYASRFEELIINLEKLADFSTVSEFLEKKESEKYYTMPEMHVS